MCVDSIHGLDVPRTACDGAASPTEPVCAHLKQRKNTSPLTNFHFYYFQPYLNYLSNNDFVNCSEISVVMWTVNCSGLVHFPQNCIFTPPYYLWYIYENICGSNCRGAVFGFCDDRPWYSEFFLSKFH